MSKLLTAFSSERGLKGCSVRVWTGLDGSARGRASALWRAGLCVCLDSGATARGRQVHSRAPRGDGALVARHSDAGTPGCLSAARLTVEGVTERRIDRMDEHVQTAEAVRQACIAAALQAYEDAGVSGLCHEGRWEY